MKHPKSSRSSPDLNEEKPPVKTAIEIAQERAEQLLSRSDEELNRDNPPGNDQDATSSSSQNQASAEIAEYIDHLQRLQAEFDNYRKRVEKEKIEFVKYATASLLAPLSEVLDDFERGLQEDHLQDVPEGFLNGMKGIYRKFHDLLQRQGLERISTVGEVFNPEIHEAAMQEETEVFPPGVISGEIRPGYRLRDRLLRAPLVKVAAAPKKK